MKTLSEMIAVMKAAERGETIYRLPRNIGLGAAGVWETCAPIAGLWTPSCWNWADFDYDTYCGLNGMGHYDSKAACAKLKQIKVSLLDVARLLRGMAVAVHKCHDTRISVAVLIAYFADHFDYSGRGEIASPFSIACMPDATDEEP